MSIFADKYTVARAMSDKYRDAPRAGWMEPGSKARKNQAIMVQREEALRLADNMASAIYGNCHRVYEIMALRNFMSQLAEGEPDAEVCPKCHHHFLPGWMDGKCPLCAAEQAATAQTENVLGGGQE